MKLGQGNVFTGICDSVNRGVCLSACWDTSPPGPGTPSEHPSPAQSMLGDTVNERAVRILLECNLVLLPFRVEYTMAQGDEWVTRRYDQSLRSPCDHAYYLGKFLRMDHPEMKTIPTIEEHHVVDPLYLQEGPEYLCYKVSDKVKSSLKNTHQDYAQFEMRICS